MGEPSEYEKEEERPVSRPLHNFTLPNPLKWGHKRQLHHMKPTPCNDRRRGGGGRGGGGSKPPAVPPKPHRSLAGSFGQKKGKDNMIQDPCGAVAAATFSGADGGCNEIAEVRQKLTTDLQTKAKLMKQSFLYGNEKKKSSEEELNDSRPWNLRTRRGGGGGSNGGGGCGNTGLLPSSTEEEKSGNGLQRPKFSLSLTKEEIEADFIATNGAKPPRRPKRRPKNIQKHIDGLLPGSWLREVTPDTYKVPENCDKSKR